MTIAKVWPLCVAAMLSTAAQAEGRFTAAISGGSLGIGPEVGYRLNDTIGIRANASLLNFSHDFDSDDIEYDGKLKLKSVGAMVDVYPFGGGFRISGGARINGTKARALATPTAGQTVEIGGTDYVVGPDNFIRGRARVKDFAPALTLGYGGSNRSGFMFGVEAGALFQGKVRIRNFVTNIPGVSATDLEEERLSLQDDVDDYKVYPILQISVGYRF